MGAAVILDADFLSAFLKTERLPLLLTRYQVAHLCVPSAVCRKLAVTSLLPSCGHVRTVSQPHGH